MLVVPVLPRTFQRSAGRRSRSVPLRPATASEARNGPRTFGLCSAAAITSTSAVVVSRSRLERPEPSAIRTPVVSTPAAFSSSITTRAPAAVEPTAPVLAPSAFSSSSAV